MACCINLGIKDSCEPINTGYTATQTGTYQYVIHWANARIKGSVNVQQGDPIILDCKINENAYYKVDITAPDGTALTCVEFFTRYFVSCNQNES